jgi:hypothetical protein
MKNQYISELELNELFEFLPKNLEVFGYIDERALYSNDTIVQTFLNTSEKNPLTSPIKEKIKEGLINKKILIGFFEPNIFQFYKRKIIKKVNSWNFDVFRIDLMPVFEENSLGLYSSSQDIIVIILDYSKIDIFGKMIMNGQSVLSHELCHMAVANNREKFLSLYGNKLISFYSEWIKNVLIINKKEDVEIKKNNVATLVRDLVTNLEGKGKTNIKLQQVVTMWKLCFQSILGDVDVKPFVKTVFTPFEVIIMEHPIKSKKQLIDSVYAIANAYREIGVSSVLNFTTPAQEVLFPSEVFCISNQWDIKSEALQLIKSIPMVK